MASFSNIMAFFRSDHIYTLLLAGQAIAKIKPDAAVLELPNEEYETEADEGTAKPTDPINWLLEFSRGVHYVRRLVLDAHQYIQTNANINAECRPFRSLLRFVLQKS
jgi:hypothetical protein